jgi:hypothetical protein
MTKEASSSSQWGLFCGLLCQERQTPPSLVQLKNPLDVGRNEEPVGLYSSRPDRAASQFKGHHADA